MMKQRSMYHARVQHWQKSYTRENYEPFRVSYNRVFVELWGVTDRPTHNHNLQFCRNVIAGLAQAKIFWSDAPGHLFLGLWIKQVFSTAPERNSVNDMIIFKLTKNRFIQDFCIPHDCWFQLCLFCFKNYSIVTFLWLFSCYCEVLSSVTYFGQVK